MTVLAPAARERTRPTWDLVLTIVLLASYLLETVIATIVGVLLVFMSDSCGSSSYCNDGQLTAGIAIAAFGVWIPVVFVLVGSVLLLVFKRRAFWVPLVGMVLTVAIWILGFVVTISSVTGYQHGLAS
jgi:uncharacterized Tic20 family protein